MFFCGVMETLWPWDLYRRLKKPGLRQIHTSMSGAFFHKGISRLKAEELLTKAGDGSFLVRDSETLTGAYVLCLLSQKLVHQYRVLPDPDGKLSVQSENGPLEQRYKDLNELIAGYVTKGERNGLACPLRIPVQPEKEDEVDTDDEDFEYPISTHPLGSTHFSYIPDDPRLPQVDLLQNFARLDLSKCDGEFTNALKNYVDYGRKKDITSMENGESDIPEFQDLLELAAKGLHGELDRFILKVNLMAELLQKGGETERPRRGSIQVAGSKIPAMLEKLSQCRTSVIELQNQAIEALQLASVPAYDYQLSIEEDSSLPTRMTPLMSSLYQPHIPQSKFEVKCLKHGKTSKLSVTVDIQAGKFFAVKASKDVLDSKNTFLHERIIQLVKNTRDKGRLDVVLKGKTYTYLFENVHQRENFCQEIMHMKKIHSKETELDQVSVFIGTWNMGDTAPNTSLSCWLKCNGKGQTRDPRVLGLIPHDIYVIGTQESAMTEKDWVNTLKASLKSSVMIDVDLVELCTMWGIRLVILVKPEHRKSVSRIQKSSVKTGIANALGNKGAVAISFYINGTSFCFINAHLTAGDERVSRRNQNYRDITKRLSLGQKHFGLFDVTNQFHHVFWLGDLNYRIEGEIELLLKKIEEEDIKFLKEREQLKLAQENKQAFCGFNEAKISFLPTYRLERNQPKYIYDWRKVKKTGVRINNPSWTDRILWRSYPGTFLENIAYGCADSIYTSDHRPVFGSFNVGIASDFVMNRASLIDESPVQIVFESIEAQVRTCCKHYFFLEFHSTCLPEVYSSKPNETFSAADSGTDNYPMWNSYQIPELVPVFGDEDFLEDQHILIAVRCRDSDHESYGECVVTLKDTFDTEFHPFECILLHQGDHTGKLRGQMKVVLGNHAKQVMTKKSYELVSLDTNYHDPDEWMPGTPNFELRKDLGSRHPPDHQTLKSSMSSPAGLYSSADRPSSSYMDTQKYEMWQIPESHEESKAQIKGDLPPIARKPKLLMGQSSLSSNQRQVIPVASPTANVLNRLSGISDSPPPRDCSPTIHPAGDWPVTTSTEIPPPLPRKLKLSSTDNPHEKGRNSKDKPYEGLVKPVSVKDWLSCLGLSEYASSFLRSGWDSMCYMKDITNLDLTQMGMVSREHRERILSSIRDMNS